MHALDVDFLVCDIHYVRAKECNVEQNVSVCVRLAFDSKIRAFVICGTNDRASVGKRADSIAQRNGVFKVHRDNNNSERWLEAKSICHSFHASLWCGCCGSHTTAPLAAFDEAKARRIAGVHIPRCRDCGTMRPGTRKTRPIYERGKQSARGAHDTNAAKRKKETQREKGVVTRGRKTASGSLNHF